MTWSYAGGGGSELSCFPVSFGGGLDGWDGSQYCVAYPVGGPYPGVHLSCASWWRCWIIVRLLTWLGRCSTRIVWLTSLRWHCRSSRIICNWPLLNNVAWLRWIESRRRSIVRGWLIKCLSAETS